jgi:cytochrome c-type biogenesis protein
VIALSFLAGALSTLSPCILPLIPILLGSALQQHRMGPLALVGGLALSFSGLGILFASAGFALALDPDVLREAAAVAMAGFGLVLLSASLRQRFAGGGSAVMASANRLLAGLSGIGLGGQFVLGLLLGIVWAPCAGPTLGAAIGLAAQSDTALRAALMMAVYSVGAATPVLILAYGSRRFLSGSRSRLDRLARLGNPAMGAALIVIAGLVLTDADKRVETVLTDAMPGWLLDFATRI